MAKKAAPKKAAPPAPVAAPPPPPKPQRPIFRSFDDYATAHPDVANIKINLGCDYYGPGRYLFFPIDVTKTPQHLPGGYLMVSADSYEPGTLSADKPHFWVSIYNGDTSMRKWCFHQSEVDEALEEIAVLDPQTVADLENLGYRQDS